MKPAPLPPPPAALVARFKLAPFYRQWLDAGGLPVVASEKVSPYALFEARFLIDRMLEKRPDVRAELIRAGVRVAILGVNERTTDIPEHADLTPKDYWDRRARGLGATKWRPAISGAEENLLQFPGDPYAGESIFLHEFSHAVDEMGLRIIQPGFEARLKECFESARREGRWKDTYAITNVSEYWAEAVQSYLDCNQPKINASHNGVFSRERLRAHDPEVLRLIEESLKTAWRWTPLEKRPSRERKHLRGYDPKTAPTFRW